MVLTIALFLLIIQLILSILASKLTSKLWSNICYAIMCIIGIGGLVFIYIDTRNIPRELTNHPTESR